MKRIAVIFVWTVLAVVARGQSSLPERSNLNDYDKIYIQNSAGENPAPIVAAARRFVWEHWTVHALGLAEVTLRNKEGEPTKYTIRIEPNASGVWRVSIKIERESYDRRLIGDPRRTGGIRRVATEFEAFTVERAEPPKGRAASTPTGERNLPLRFKDQNGKILAEF